MNRKVTLRSSGITILLLTIGIAFLAIGIWRKEHAIVMAKAINICLECIGIG